jgi:gliding motility-associated-like protein
MRLGIFCIFLLFFAKPVSSTHIVGGEIYYSYLGNDNYEIRLTVYRDCFNGIPPFDDTAYVGIWDASNNLIMQLAMSPNDSTTVPSTINSPCFIPPTGICVRVANYYAIVNLPSIPGGYQLAYQRCCRNQTILNVVNPLDVGATFYTTIPGNGVINSSPVFNALPPAFACNGYPLVFDHAATDADGDSLVYSICNPLDVATPGIAVPDPNTAPPPFLPIPFQPPFNLANLMGGTPLTIDPATGELTALPNTLGQFVVGICVSEYRNGQLIGNTLRDYQINVVNCPSLVVAGIISPGVVCGSNTIQMTNNSFGASSYLWNFYDPSVSNSTSTAFSPSWTYPDTGTYVVSLIAFSTLDSTCTDTTARVVTLLPEFVTDFEIDTTRCSYQVTFTDSSNTAAGTINFWDWDFGDGSPKAYTSNPTHTYPGPGTYTVTLITRSTGFCRDTITKTFTLDPPPSFQPFFAGPTSACVGSLPPNLFVNIATSTGQSFAPYRINYSINGVPQIPITTLTNQASIILSTSTVGSQLFQITGITSLSNPACGSSGTTNFLFNVYNVVDATITPPLAFCFNETASIDLVGIGGIAPYIFTYNIDNGPNLVAVTSSGSDTATISINTSIPGSYTLNLVSVSGAGNQTCPANTNSSSTITVLPEFVIDFQIDTSLCSYQVQFTDSSNTGAGSINSWDWNFGDGSPNATSANPQHTYSGSGTYSVTLISTSSSSCKDTITKTFTLEPPPSFQPFFAGPTSACVGASPPTLLVNIATSNGQSLAPYQINYSINGVPQNPVSTSNNQASIVPSTITAGSQLFQITGITSLNNPACGSSGTTNFLFNVYNLVDAIIGSPMMVCLNDSATVEFIGTGGTAPYTFTYNIDNGPNITATTPNGSDTAAINFNTSIPGSFTLNLISISGSGNQTCPYTPNISTSITVVDLPDANISIDTTTVCQFGNSPIVSFIGTGGTPPYSFNYTINGLAGQTLISGSSSSSASIQLPTNNSGTFNVILNSVEAADPIVCNRAISKSVSLEVIPLPGATVSGGSIVCKNDTPVNIELIGNNSTPPYIFSYTQNGGPIQYITSINNTANLSISTSSADTIPILLTGVTANTNPVCPASLSEYDTVIVRELPNSTIYGPDSLCLDEPLSIATIECSNGIPPFQIVYSLNNGPSIQTTTTGMEGTIQLPTNIPGINSINLISVSDGGTPSCTTGLGITNEYYVEDIGVRFVAKPVSCPFSGEYKFLNQTVNGNFWNWDFGDGSSSLEASPEHDYMIGGLYEVFLIATSNSGCTDSFNIDLEITQPYRIWVPNAFTPNGDSRNELFKPITTMIQDYELVIRNRWGLAVFESNDPDKGWDGKLGGKEAPEGIYIYVVTTTDLCGKQDVRKGTVALIR